MLLWVPPFVSLPPWLEIEHLHWHCHSCYSTHWSMHVSFTPEYLGHWCTVCGSHSWVHFLRHSDISSVLCTFLIIWQGVGRLNPTYLHENSGAKKEIKIICLFFSERKKAGPLSILRKGNVWLIFKKTSVYLWSQWWNKWLSRGIQSQIRSHPFKRPFLKWEYYVCFCSIT